MATLDDARELALALPATTERPSYGTPGFRVKDKLFARSREDDVLVVWVADLGEKEMLVRSEPDKFFTVPHYDGHASVLVRLSAVGREELGELLTDAWRTRAPKRLVAELDADVTAADLPRADARPRPDLRRGGRDVGLAHDLVGIGDVADRAVERFAALPDGTFVWTRSSDGLFHLGRIAGPHRPAPHGDDRRAAPRPAGDVAGPSASRGRGARRGGGDVRARRTQPAANPRRRGGAADRRAVG